MLQPVSPGSLSPPYLTGSVFLHVLEDLYPRVWFSFLGVPALSLNQKTQACCLFLQAPVPMKDGPQPHFATETEELGTTTLRRHFHKPVLGDLDLPMNLLGSHWEWGHTCSLRTVWVGEEQILQDAKAIHTSRD